MGQLAPLLLIEALGILSFSPEGADPQSLFQAAVRADEEGKRDEALEILRRLHREHADSDEAEQAVEIIERLAPLTFASVPERVNAGEKAEVSRPPAVAAAFRIYRVDSEALRRRLESEPGTGEPAWPGRGSWTAVGPEKSSSINLGTLEPGAYVVEEWAGGFRKRHRVSVQSFALLVRALAGKGVVCAVVPSSGDPVEGVRLKLRSAAGAVEALTSPDGLAILEPCGSGTLIASRGGEVQTLPLRLDGEPAEELVYLTTDRPIYRPGQTVHFKAVHRIRKGADFSFRPGEKVRVELLGQKGRVVSSLEDVWSPLGTFAGSFDLGDRAPGYYGIRVLVPYPRWSMESEPSHWSLGFPVDAYRKPDFQLTIAPIGSKHFRGERVRLEVAARYFFDEPVEGAKVEWYMTAFEPSRRPLSPYPPPGDTGRWVLEGARPREEDDRWRRSVFRRDGNGTTGPDGKLEILFETSTGTRPLELQVTAYATEMFRVYRQATVLVRPALVQVSLTSPVVSTRAGEVLPATARVQRMDGTPAAGLPIEFTAARKTDRSGDSEPQLDEFHSARAVTNEDGIAEFKLEVPVCPGLRLTAGARDEAGRVAEASVDLTVRQPRPDRERRPQREDAEVPWFSMEPDRSFYATGDNLRLLVQSSLAPLNAILVIEGSTIEEARRVRIEQTLDALELPVRQWLRSRLSARLFVFEAGKYWTHECQLTTAPTRPLLDVEVGTNRAAYRPGEKMRIAVATRVDGKPVAAEVELSVMDEAVFGLRPESTPDIRWFFHGKLFRRGDTATTLKVDNRRVRGGGGGISGGDPTRTYFPDTLLWNGRLQTDADGRAVVEVEAPGSLTAWRITARGVAGADLFGAARSPAISRKDVVARLVAPRFLTERDEATAAVVVHSYLEQPAGFTVRLSASGSVAGEETVRLGPGETRRFSWPLPRAAPGTLRLRAEAASPFGSDAMELDVPVRPHGVEEEAVAGGRVDGRWKESLVLPPDAVVETASLEVSVAGAGRAAVRDALPFLAGYPHGCVEQTMSRFLPALAAARALRDAGVPNAALERDLPAMVERGLDRLYSLQKPDGGWGWWRRDKSAAGMTAYVVQGLSRAKSSGFPVDAGSLERGVAYLRKARPHPATLLARASAGDKVDRELAEAVPTDANEAALLVLAGRRDLVNRLPTEPPPVSGPTEVETTALVARALASADRADPRIGPLIAWLLAARRGGAWWSTLDSAHAVLALIEAGAAEREEPKARVSINGTVPLIAHGLPRAGVNSIEVACEGPGPVFASALLRYRTTAEMLPARAAPLRVTRRFERRVLQEGHEAWEAIGPELAVRAGERLRVVISVEAPRPVSFVYVESPLPAGVEPAQNEEREGASAVEIHDDRVAAAIQSSAELSRELEFDLFAAHPGTYHVLPASAFAMYDPRERGSSEEAILRVLPRE